MQWARSFSKRKRLEHDLDRELLDHLQRRTDELTQRGMSVEDARRQANIEFGGLTQAKEEVRDTWFARWFHDWLRDLAYGSRMLRRNPGFAAVGVLSLAFGIGANTAVFSLINAVMLRMLPVAEPERLVQVVKYLHQNTPGAFSYPVFERLRDQIPSFEGAFAHEFIGRREVILNAEPEEAMVELVSASYHSVLGLQPAIGRLFTSADHSSQLAVLSNAYWRRRFAADPQIIGSKLTINNSVFTICGVTPPEFFGVLPGEASDITFPIGVDGVVRGGSSRLKEKNINFLSVMARLRPGAAMARAQAEAAFAFAPMVEEDARERSQEFLRARIRAQRLEVHPAATGLDKLRSEFSQPLFFLMGIVALVLLLACANVANLLLVRAVERKSELSVRLAIGASRGRVVRQMLTEGLLLAALGGALGIAIAYGLSEALIVMMSNGAARMAVSVEPDFRVLAFATAASVMSCFAFALAPALSVTKRILHPSIKESGTAARHRLGQGLVVLQVAISAVLLVAAGLFIRTLVNLQQLDTGFEKGGRVVFSLNIKKTEFANERLGQLVGQIHQRLQSVPGINSATYSLLPPVSGGQWTGDIVIEGYTYKPGESRDLHFNEAGSNYFRTLGTPILLGREFADRDTSTAPKVAVVNQAFARRYYQGASPVGKRIRRPSNPDSFEIVGLVKDVQYESLRQAPPPTVYFATSQSKTPQNWHSWIVRSEMPTSALQTSIEAALRDVHQSLRITDIKTLDDHVNRTILRERLMATLSSFFGSLALALAALGIYGVIAFTVTARKREIGIRIALGAQQNEVIWLVFRQAAVLVVLGIGIGLAIAIGVSRTASSMLFNLHPSDPVTFVAAAATLLAAGGLAAYLPARLATRLNPVQAIQHE